MNGRAPTATASRKRKRAGSPGGSSSRRGHTTTSASSASISESTSGDAHCGTNTRQRPLAPLGQRGCGDRCVAARGDGERRPHGVRQAERLGRTEMEQDARQVPTLVAAPDVAGLVFDPHGSRVAAEVQVVVAEGSHLEPGGEVAGEGDQRPLGHAVGRRERPPRHPWPVGDEGVGIVEALGSVAGRPRQRVQDVAAVSRRRARTRERVRRGDVDGRAAHGAAPTEPRSMRSPATQAVVGRSFAGAHSLAPVDNTELNVQCVPRHAERSRRDGSVEVIDHRVPDPEEAAQAGPERLRRDVPRRSRSACPVARPT